MERRVLIAAIISLAIAVLYQELVMKRFLVPPNATPPTIAEPPAALPPTAEAPQNANAPAAPAPGPEVAAPPSIAGTDVVVDTELYTAVFTTAGARLKSMQLKDYATAVSPGSPPLQMVQYPVEAKLPLGIALRGGQSTPTLSDSSVAYRADRDRIEIAANGSGSITFTGELGGAAVSKRIELRGDSYEWALDASITSPPAGYTEMALGWEEGMNPAGPNAAEVVFDTIVVLQNDKLTRDAFTGLDAGKLVENNITWLAFTGSYFVAAIVPHAEDQNALRVWEKRTDQTVEAQLLYPPGLFHAAADLFVGPKVPDLLEAADHKLSKTIDLGFFTIVARPMLDGLKLLHRITGNWGVAIILLTVIIKVAFYPLTKKSFESMKAMQKLQPEMAKIRERLQDKPEEMNREIMELYKRHKVNPLGGCLPMLLQLPVFFGLYSALRNAIALRHAPFIGWITDLSAPDRLGTIQLPFVAHPGIPVLTLTMGVSMFLQQWMTPSAADPQQQRVMMIMPLMFTFMFINFPAGLSLYWLTNNLLTIAQQYSINRTRQR
jgi:YidC/Oxa1 family membrane protein insertase